jgi:hypothetical protein
MKTIPTEISVTSEQQVSSTLTRIHGLGGLGLAGFFGGPLAISYLIYRDLIVLRREDLLLTTAVWFVPFIVFWLYCIFSFPPDLISQWILYLPQTILWWIVARHLLGKIHACYQEQECLFRPRLQAIKFGFFTFVAIKIFFFVFDFVNAILAE